VETILQPGEAGLWDYPPYPQGRRRIAPLQRPSKQTPPKSQGSISGRALWQPRNYILNLPAKVAPAPLNARVIDAVLEVLFESLAPSPCCFFSKLLAFPLPFVRERLPPNPLGSAYAVSAQILRRQRLERNEREKAPPGLNTLSLEALVAGLDPAAAPLSGSQAAFSFYPFIHGRPHIWTEYTLRHATTIRKEY
jgi:hypothetical protein